MAARRIVHFGMLGLLLVWPGCPSGEPPVEIVLVNARADIEVRTLRLFDLVTPVSDNLLDSAVPPMHSRRVQIPLEDTFSADSIAVGFALPGDDRVFSYLPDNVAGGFVPGKVIVFVLAGDEAFDVPFE